MIHLVKNLFHLCYLLFDYLLHLLNQIENLMSLLNSQDDKIEKDGYACLGNSPAILAAGIAYFLDFKGPAFRLIRLVAVP